MSMFTRWSAIGQSSIHSASAANKQQMLVKDLISVYDKLEMYRSNEITEMYFTSDSDAYVSGPTLYNPTARAVDFFVHRVWTSVWTDDGLPLPDGTPSTVPFASDVEETVRLASMTALKWSNWELYKNLYVSHGATFADVFLKPTLDVDARKVYVNVYDPRYVKELEFNNRRDVIGFLIEIPDRKNDAQRTPYTYGERWSKESFTTYLDGREHGYDGLPYTQANPFGFVPGKWVNHRYIGGLHGAPAIDGVIPKIIGLNRIVNSAHNFGSRLSEQPIGIASDKTWGQANNGIYVVNSEPDGSGRKRSGVLKMPADARVFPLIQDIGLGQLLSWAQELIAEIEKDLPETVMDAQLRQMTDVPGFAIPRLIGDTANKLYEAQGNYDSGLMDVCQMMISMASYAVKTGLWGPTSQLTEAQRMFGQFDLTSYDKGELSISFMQRPILPTTATERAELALLRESVKTTIGLSESGYSEEAIYGEDASGNSLAPSPMPGIIEQRSQSQPTQSAASLFGGLINQGAV